MDQEKGFRLIVLPIDVTEGAVADSRELKNFQIHKYQIVTCSTTSGHNPGF